MAQMLVPVGIALAGGLAGTLAAKALAPKAKAAAQTLATPPPTRNMAADAARGEDAWRRRRGAGANVLTGPRGAEARSPGGKALLGQ